MVEVLTFHWLLALPKAVQGFRVRVSPSREKVTHTSQVYDEKDYRRFLFIDCQKEVNENFAIDLIAEQPVNEVDHWIISCDKGGGALGHSKVYIGLDKEIKQRRVATMACSSSSTITSVGSVLVL